MTHYPTLRSALLRWLPARCACGARRFDCCPDAIADAQAGHLAPRGGGYDASASTLRRIAGELDRNGRGWWPA